VGAAENVFSMSQRMRIVGTLSGIECGRVVGQSELLGWRPGRGGDKGFRLWTTSVIMGPRPICHLCFGWTDPLPWIRGGLPYDHPRSTDACGPT
jgi:hypothetical protein